MYAWGKLTTSRCPIFYLATERKRDDEEGDRETEEGGKKIKTLFPASVSPGKVYLWSAMKLSGAADARGRNMNGWLDM